jgi:hypothetical protein
MIEPDMRGLLDLTYVGVPDHTLDHPVMDRPVAVRNAYIYAVKDARPDAYWRLNPSAAPVMDATGQHDLTVVGAPLFDLPGAVADPASNSMSGWSVHLVPADAAMVRQPMGRRHHFNKDIVRQPMVRRRFKDIEK